MDLSQWFQRGRTGVWPLFFADKIRKIIAALCLLISGALGVVRSFLAFAARLTAVMGIVLSAMPWLLFSAPVSLQWRAQDGARYLELPATGIGRPGFKLLDPSATGIALTNVLSSQRSLTNQILLNGSGVAAGDVDGDGRVDLYFCRLEGGNALYRNLGNWRFEDITAAAEVSCEGMTSTGAALVDIDGDGDLDLVVNTFGTGTHIFLNDGQGHFKEAPYVLNDGKGGMSLAFADVNGDGYLDLYIANYRTTSLTDMPNTRFGFQTVAGKPILKSVNGRSVAEPDLMNRFRITPDGRIDENGEEDAFYLNRNGAAWQTVPFTGGAFLDESGKPLKEPPHDWGLSVMFRDFNGDGLPDLYVCNDFDSEDRLWINRGNLQFQAASEFALRKTSFFSMGIDVADLDRDGFDDFLVLDMLSRDHRQRMTTLLDHKLSHFLTGGVAGRAQYARNTLLFNRGDGTYAEIAYYSGLEASDWSWCPVFLDVDLDGFEDLLITNGNERDGRNQDVVNRLKTLRESKKMSATDILEARRLFPPYQSARLAFHNVGGMRFEEVGREWGFDDVGVGQGMCLADLDGDGDMDVIVNNLNGAPGLYRNESTAPRVAVRLKGQGPNTRGIGAKIWLYGGAVPMQSQEMISGGRYLSSDDAMRVFAAGSLTNEMRIEVRWRSGKRSVVNGVRANRLYEIEEAGAEPANSKLQAPSSKETPNFQLPTANSETKPVFEDVSRLIGHVHQEEEYNDFERQPLLANKLSQLGPGVGWYDLEGDGREDLIVGSGKGGKLAVYRYDRQKGFQLRESAVLNDPVRRDQTGVLGWSPGPGVASVLVGSANYEDGLSNGESVLRYDYQAGGWKRGVGLPASGGSVGPLALGDMDGDGHLELFVGGRVIAGRYPEAAASRIYRYDGKQWELEGENSRLLEKVGLVSGAVWSDLDGDGYAELILACEWAPVRVFHNERGRLREATKALGLEAYSGWWNGVSTGDLDGDGRMDLIAGNWGLNTKYRASREHPRKIYYGELGGQGTVDIVEAYYDEAMNKEVPERDLNAVGAALPWVREKYTSYAAYGQAGVQEIYGEKLKAMRVVEAGELASMVFLNRGDHFEAKALPREAQWSPAFGVCVGDYDGDGKEDVFLSQNFFAVQAETSRNDAGRGLWLRGDGKGALTPVPGQESGVKVYGEQRGAALCDYDGDGRVDLVVTQNGAQTKLFHNVGARPGLRVKLKGPPGNPQGIGAQMRLVFGQRLGPAREIHAGSGYWSQDSAVEVLGTPQPPTQIQIRWPGGKTTTSPVPPGTRELTLSFDASDKSVQ